MSILCIDIEYISYTRQNEKLDTETIHTIKETSHKNKQCNWMCIGFKHCFIPILIYS